MNKIFKRITLMTLIITSLFSCKKTDKSSLGNNSDNKEIASGSSAILESTSKKLNLS